MPEPNEVDGDMLFFFVPTVDDLDRDHYAYVRMSVDNAEYILSGEAGSLIYLSDYATILHVERGYWPDEMRREELKGFYSQVVYDLAPYLAQKMVA